MRRFLTCLCVAVFLGSAVSGADEEKVPLDKVPKEVLSAVKARFKGVKPTEVTKETDKDKKTVYEVTITVKEMKIDVTVTPDGKIIMIEKQIPAKDLPKDVSKAVEEKYPKPTYKIAEEVIKIDGKDEKLEYYEVLIQTADKEFIELQVSPKGKILATEKKKSEKD